MKNLLFLTILLSASLSLHAQTEAQGDTLPDIPGAIQAAKEGNVDAQCFLGIIYSVGQYNVEQNYAEAIKWFTMAAEQGEPTAQYNLSLFYIEGFGVAPDTLQAQKWYNLALQQTPDLPPLIVPKPATNDFTFSGKKSKKSDKISKKDKIKFDQAFQHYHPKAMAGDRVAQYNLGVLYNDGLGTPRNYKEANKWFTLAAQQGDPDAQNNLGIMYYEGQGVGKNYSLAFHWYTLAAEQGHYAAQYNLGIMYEQGIGTEKNRAKAKQWFMRAADQGYTPAQERLKNL